MAITLKPLATIVTKWQTNAGAATSSYTLGVQNPRQDWATMTEASANTWSSAVAAAAANGRFAKGVAKAGTPFWQSRSLTLGASRYSGGIQAGSANYNAGFTPYYQALGTLTLPAKLPTGDPGNIARVQAVDNALHALKLQIG